MLCHMQLYYELTINLCLCTASVGMPPPPLINHSCDKFIAFDLHLQWSHSIAITLYYSCCHSSFVLMFVTSQLKGIVILNASMNVCYSNIHE